MAGESLAVTAIGVLFMDIGNRLAELAIRLAAPDLGQRQTLAAPCRMTLPARVDEPSLNPAQIIGMAALVRLAYERGNLAELWSDLLRRAGDRATQAAALLDMSLVLQTLGQRDEGLKLQ
jgi:hypothetical protein